MALNLIDRTLRRFGYVKASKRKADFIRAVAREAGPEIRNYDLYENQSRAYAISSWISFCVGSIAEDCANVPLQVKERTGEHDLEEIEDHDFERLLRTPNDKWSRFELLEATFGYLALNGNAFWYLTLGADGLPVEIWPLRPSRVSIVPDPQKWVKKYIYKVSGVDIPLERDEVLHFKRWHPLKDYEGLSPIEAAGLAVQSDVAALKWNANFFRNRALPDSLVRVPSYVTDEELDRIEAEWEQEYGGADNAGKTAFIRADDWDFQQVLSTLKDMDFVNLRRLTREDIFYAYRIPMGLFSENATEANAIVADKRYSKTLWGYLVRVHEKITAEVLPRYGEELVAEFQDVRPSERELDLQELSYITQGTVDETGMRQPVMTPNEIRARYWDLPPMEEVALEEEAGFISGTEVAPEEEPEPVLPGQELAFEEADEEIKKWQRMALSRLKEEKPEKMLSFHSIYIPETIVAIIHERLVKATTREAIRQAFQEARGLLQAAASLGEGTGPSA